MINCDNCNGGCCRWIFVNYSNELRQASLLRGAKIIQQNGEDKFFAYAVPCSKWTASGRCSIYRTRPKFCKDFLVGSGICLLVRKLEGYSD
jgi:hypothetical protein